MPCLCVSRIAGSGSSMPLPGQLDDSAVNDGEAPADVVVPASNGDAPQLTALELLIQTQIDECRAKINGKEAEISRMRAEILMNPHSFGVFCVVLLCHVARNASVHRVQVSERRYD